jgi:hypothetical protein
MTQPVKQFSETSKRGSNPVAIGKRGKMQDCRVDLRLGRSNGFQIRHEVTGAFGRQLHRR